jgi:signal transduction histidine kinase/ligand-binding sensor domain-containing protein
LPAALIGLLAAGPAVAADPVSSTAHALTGYALTSWPRSQGSRLGSVYAVAQDSDGYLWIGADAGLFRFDGSVFTKWDDIGQQPLPAGPISALHVTPDNSLWVGLGHGGGVRRLRGSRLETAPTLDGVTGAVADLIADRHGVLWAVADSTLFRLRRGAWSKVKVTPDDPQPVPLHPHASESGGIWVGTTRGLFQLEESDTFALRSPGFTWDAVEGSHGRTWISDIVGGFRQLADLPAPSRPFQGAAYRLMRDRQDNLWVATMSDGLWRAYVDATTGEPVIERLTTRTGLSSDSVQSVFEDRDGNIWIGTTAGLHRLTKRQLTPVENVGFAMALESAGDEGMVVGTTNGLIRMTFGEHGWVSEPLSLPGPGVRSLHRDDRDTLWIGTNVGLWRRSGKQTVAVPLPRPYSARPITLLASDRAGFVWLGFDDWLFSWDGASLRRLELPPHIRFERIAFVQGGRNGGVWIASDKGQVVFRDARNEFHEVIDDAPVSKGSSGKIYAVLQETDGTVWVGGSGGLLRYAGGRATTLNERQGLPGNRVWSILNDGAGYLWLSMDAGLVRISLKELERTNASTSAPLQYKLYDASDGLAGSPLGVPYDIPPTRMTAHVPGTIHSERDATAHLWFIRGGGLTIVDANTLTAPLARTVPVRVETVVANERRFDAASGTVLPAGTRRLQITYTAVALTESNKVSFRYRLDGFDGHWIDAGERRQAFYTNLSPGSYRFRVEAHSDDGTWQTAATTWDFGVAPAFYQTPWFYGAMLVLTGLAIGGAWRLRLRLVRRQFSLVLAERTRLSRELHDTLLQSLVGIGLQFDIIVMTLDQSPEAAKAHIARIRRTVQAYVRDTRQSIWDLRSPSLESRDLVTALRRFARAAVVGQTVECQVAVTGVPYRCHPTVENQLLRIGQEAITNAVRHAGAAHILVELSFESALLMMRVSDDGVGFSSVTQPQGEDGHYGLATMRERAEEVGGTFSLSSNPGRGTVIEVVVPVPAGTSAAGERRGILSFRRGASHS